VYIKNYGEKLSWHTMFLVQNFFFHYTILKQQCSPWKKNESCIKHMTSSQRSRSFLSYIGQIWIQKHLVSTFTMFFIVTFLTAVMNGINANLLGHDLCLGQGHSFQRSKEHDSVAYEHYMFHLLCIVFCNRYFSYYCLKFYRIKWFCVLLI
jgi:hypothetical protein